MVVEELMKEGKGMADKEKGSAGYDGCMAEAH